MFQLSGRFFCNSVSSHMPLYSSITRSGLYFFSSETKYSRVSSSEDWGLSKKVFVAENWLRSSSQIPSSHKRISVLSPELNRLSSKVS